MPGWFQTQAPDQHQSFAQAYILAAAGFFKYAERLGQADFTGWHIDVFLIDGIAVDDTGLQFCLRHNAHMVHLFLKHIFVPEHEDTAGCYAGGDDRHIKKSVGVIGKGHGHVHAKKTGNDGRDCQNDGDGG